MEKVYPRHPHQDELVTDPEKNTFFKENVLFYL